MAEYPFEVAHKLVESAFKAHWTAVGGSTPVEYQNAPFPQPDSGEWLRLTVLFGKGVQASIGASPLEKIAGVATVQAVVPKGSGARRANRLADMAAAGLRYRQFSEGGVTVSMRAPERSGGGEEPDCYVAAVSVAFEVQHIAG